MSEPTQNAKKILKSKRRSKRADVKESFECECQRKYLSFSALYLHAKNKHQVRLSSKPSPGACLVDKIDGLTNYKFFLSANPTENKEPSAFSQIPQLSSPPNQPSPLSLALSDLALTVVKDYQGVVGSKTQQMIAQDFLSYVCLNQGHQNSTEQLAIQKAPQKLNQYVMNFVPESRGLQAFSPEWHSLCQNLFQFCNWLRLNNWTDLHILRSSP